MLQLDVALRAAGVGMLLLVGLVLVLSAPRRATALWFLPFALGVSGFLAVNAAGPAAELPDPLWSLASLLSRLATVFVWWFCLALFDNNFRPRAVELAGGGAWLALVVVDKRYLFAAPAGIDLSAMLIALGVGMMGHLGWRLMRDFRGDLIESRRRARPVFVGLLAAFLMLDFGIDISMGYGWRPPGFLLLQNGLIVLLTMGLGAWLLTADAKIVAGPDLRRRTAPVVAKADPDAALLSRLEALMTGERPYLDPDLTVSRFAGRLGVPEAVLRRLINHRLGFGHFRNFLNVYRIEEAKRRLRAGPGAGDKMIAIAFDSGFASLASFNRAFRQLVGRSPTEFRGGVGAPDGS